MEPRRWLGVSAFVLCLLISGCGLGGCSRTAEKVPAQLYAIVDIETVKASHKQYSDMFRLEQEYRNMVAQYEAERQTLIRRSVQAQEQLQSALGSGEIEASLNTEYRAKMMAREDMWNGKLAALYRQLLETSGKTPDDYRQGIDLEIVNLQLRLRALQLDPAERTALESRLADLLDRRDGGYVDERVLDTASRDALDDLKAQAEADLKSYAQELTKTLSAKGNEQAYRLQQMAQGSVSEQASDEWNRQWQVKISDKKKEVEKLDGHIMADIRQAAEKVAKTHGWEVVFAKYQANINAPDATGEIISAMAAAEGGQTNGK